MTAHDLPKPADVSPASVGDTLEALAARCEQATEPTRGLNWACHAARLGNARPARDELDRTLDYTGSIDAALAMVPEGWAIQVVRSADGQHGGANLYLFANEHDREPTSRAAGNGYTPALALCAAACRALAQGKSA